MPEGINPHSPAKGRVFHCRQPGCGHSTKVLAKLRSHYTKAHPRLTRQWGRKASAAKRAKANGAAPLSMLPVTTNGPAKEAMLPVVNYCPNCGAKLSQWRRRT